MNTGPRLRIKTALVINKSEAVASVKGIAMPRVVVAVVTRGSTKNISSISSSNTEELLLREGENLTSKSSLALLLPKAALTVSAATGAAAREVVKSSTSEV